MTTNYHTPITTGAPANASTVNDPLGQLDSALTDLTNGVEGISQLNLSNTTTLTINAGAITVTRTRHLVDTESSASYDDLDTINGGVAGDVLVLQSVSSSRVVVVKNGTGNIFLNGEDAYLDNPNKALSLVYNGTSWVLIGQSPIRANRKQISVICVEGGAFIVGSGAPTVMGTASLALETDSSYTKYTSDAVIGAMAGIFSTSLSHTRIGHNPSMLVWLKTGDNINGMRWYIGFHTGAIYASADNLASTGVQGVVLRYSTIAGDTGFRPVTSNGTTQLVGDAIGTISANTLYKISISIINGIAYYTINDATPVAVSANMPSGSANLGWATHLQTQQAVAKSVLYKKILVETN